MPALPARQASPVVRGDGSPELEVPGHIFLSVRALKPWRWGGENYFL